MDKIKIQKEAIVLDNKEREKLIILLQYCKHRLKKHDATGLHKIGITLDFVEYLLNNL